MYPRARGLASKNDHSDTKQCHVLIYVFLSAIVCHPPLILKQTCLDDDV